MFLFCFSTKRDFYYKPCPLPFLAFYTYSALVRDNNIFNIAQSQAKAFYIMHIAGTGPEKGFENMLLTFTANSYTIILYFNDNNMVSVVCPYCNIRYLPAIFYGIVNKVTETIYKMHFIPPNL